MSGLKEIRMRISSVKSTKQITSAMKMVAAAKLKGAQNRVTGFRPFAQKMNEMLAGLGMEKEELSQFPITAQPNPDKVLVLVFSSNRGLCGGFNTNIFKKTLQLVDTKYSENINDESIHFLAVGKKVGEMIAKKGYKVIDTANDLYDDLSFDNVSNLANRLIDFFLSGEYTRIELVFNEFKNAAVQIQRSEQLLPVEIGGDNTGANNFIYEPSREQVLTSLVPRAIRLKVFKAILDSNASEQGARMTAMHQATDNATQIIRELTLQYNKARQTAITNEILEITSGADALS